ncbi:MAG: hypothetical protein ACT4PO_05490 [Actinomycetota bacterium]
MLVLLAPLMAGPVVATRRAVLVPIPTAMRVLSGLRGRELEDARRSREVSPPDAEADPKQER